MNRKWRLYLDPSVFGGCFDIKAYNQVNLSLGYGILTIVSPKEVRFDE